MRKWLVLLALIFAVEPSYAGYLELSATGSYRTNTDTKTTYQLMQSIVGAIAYYFSDMTAVELSYTDSITRSWGETAIASQNYVETSRARLFGLDLSISLADRQAAFRPYIKLGGAEQYKTWIFEEGLVNTTVESDGFSVTGGVGFRYMLTEAFALKASVDAWTNPLNSPQQFIDYSATGGISWMF